ncbi:LPS-assembly protein LptD [Bacteroidales bacterium OttesenSCG-928-A17]|nr:LPS-assembly protein LptD [Bacteroidales bacterium OttesenSCG-928-A17]
MAQDAVSLNDSTVLSLDENIVEETELVQDSTLVSEEEKKSNAIDVPVYANAKDSMILVLKGKNRMYLYGEADVKSGDMELQAEYIELDADSSIVYATFALDSVGDEFGYPIFQQGESQYEMKKVNYNFKTKRTFITDVITQQGEGFMTAKRTKKTENDILYMEDVSYSTCDEHDDPHFRLRMTRAKVKPGEEAIFGPAYLEVEGIPLPIALPFGFFPFTSDYSSGIIMPSYSDEMTRGFSLRDGGYYFAFNDHVDLALTGEIFTKGSWGLNARSSYNKRYKFSGSINANYIVTKQEDANDPDLKTTQKDFKITWSHSQDAKFNPFITFSSSVDFSTSSFNRNQVDAIYTYEDYSKNTKASRVSWSYRHPEKPFTLSANFSIDQQSKDTTLSMTLPNLTFTVREFYPFKRKVQVGNQKWFEKIRMSYTATLANSISNVKEYEFFQKNVIKDWRNGVQHKIPISASFNMLKYITVSPSINYTERWYSTRVDKTYDPEAERWAISDTTYGFYRLYDYSASVSANTKLYGMYKPWGFFGNWTKGVVIRHVMTPSVSFSGSPDFGNSKYGYYRYAGSPDDPNRPYYSPFEGQVYGVPGRGSSGTLNFSLDNNLEMKVPIAGTDSTRKISLIDNLRFGMNYNFLKDSLNWSDLSASIRLKFGKAFTLNLQGSFETYTFSQDGTRINVPRWKAGKGIGRLKSTGTSFSYTLSNEVLKRLFSGKGSDSNSRDQESTERTSGESPPGLEGEEGGEGAPPQRTQSMRQKKKSDGEYDEDGYLLLTIPWSLNFNYSLSLSTDMSKSAFNPKTREYPYRTTQTLGVSGSITPTKSWVFNFNTSYDFDEKKFATMQCSLSRKMHCWSMTASIIPIGPYQSYSFSIAVNSSMLQDLKYQQSSSSRDAMYWGR